MQGHKSEFESLKAQREKVNKNYRKFSLLVSRIILTIYVYPAVETLFNKLTEYELTGIDFYTGSDKKQSVITHPQHEDYEQTVQDLPKSLCNPYTDIISWIKREIYDLEGL